MAYELQWFTISVGKSFIQNEQEKIFGHIESVIDILSINMKYENVLYLYI